MEVVTLDLPGCKSASQRALILAALAAGESRLRDLSVGDDTRFLRRALSDLGWEMVEEASGDLVVQGRDGPQSSAVASLSLGEGGSTLRFLVPMLAATANEVDLQLAPSLRARPQQPMLQVLAQCGTRLTPTDSGFHLRSRPTQDPGEILMPVDLSSQFFSGFLMAAGRHAQRWRLSHPPVSPGYLELTVSMLRQFRGSDILEITPSAWQQAAGFGQGQDLHIPADASAVVFFAVAAVLLQRPIQFRNGWDPRHPDVAVLDFLQSLGLLEVSDRTLHPQGLPTAAAGDSPPVFDLQPSPDSGPALAVLAAFLPGGLAMRNPERLRFKESDRLIGMERLAALCGATMAVEEGLLRFRPGPAPSSAPPFDPSGDHRLAMAAGIAALRYPGLQILQPQCVAKSFPDFWEQLARLR